MAEYKLLADDQVVWRGQRVPTQRDIDRAAGEANERGWNGTTLDMCIDDRWREYCFPSEDVLA
jgi:hypothetical protein